ncbi:MAG: methyltransferase [Bradyrhizobium sp.]|uniref:methyltransferase n=1 Tax=Bradyrhizobium sp. TaxID=376 RepID=UPI003D11BC12
MTQNRSSAVMAQRIEPHDSLDDFPTQPWATRALCEHVLFRVGRPEFNPACADTICYRLGLGDPIAPEGALVPPAFPVPGLSVWEPACNRGHMSRPLAEYFGIVRSSDIHDYGVPPDTNGCPFLYDFLFPGQSPIVNPTWITTNPPFRLAEQFIARALDIARHGVAVIVRTSFLESVGRYEALFSKTPPSVIAQFSERVPMVKGRLTATGSTATAYCWVVWFREHSAFNRSTRFIWIPPCRKQLERPGDYPEEAK